jgi:hypothetical protein
MSRFHDPHGDTLDRPGAASAVRSAVLALFARLGAAPTSEEAAAQQARLLEGIELPAAARQHLAADRARRRQAEAAYATVDGGGPAALRLALDVFADEIETLEQRLDRQTEALKSIQLYAPDPWVRRIAQQALIDRGGPLPLPAFLIDEDQDRIPLEAYRFIG